MTAPPEFELEVRNDPAHHVYFDLTGGSIVLGFSCLLFGYTLRNPSGAATAACDFYDGVDTSGGHTIIPLTFATSESIGDSWMPNGVHFKNGLYVNVTSGEVKGAVFYRPHPA